MMRSAPKSLAAMTAQSPAHALTIETRNNIPTLNQVLGFASAIGILLALGILATTVGLVRSETAGDLRTLTATGARRRTRRAITAATAGALGCCPRRWGRWSPTSGSSATSRTNSVPRCTTFR